MADKVMHFKYLSSIDSATKQLWLTTVDNDQIYNIVDENGVQLVANSVTFYANTTDLYIALPAESTMCTYIKAGTSKSFDYLRIQSFQILGNAGIEFAYEILCY